MAAENVHGCENIICDIYSINKRYTMYNISDRIWLSTVPCRVGVPVDKMSKVNVH